MRSGVIILGGMALWLLFFGATQLVSGLNARSVSAATVAFAGLWFIAAVGNMCMGIARAGYSFRDEFPIFLLIFFVPVAVAIFVKLKWWSAAA